MSIFTQESDKLKAAASGLDIAPFLNNVNKFVLNPIISLLFALALLVFFWGLFVFIAKADSPEERENGKRKLLWGVIGMFIMVSVYAIIRIILGTFGVLPPDYIG